MIATLLGKVLVKNADRVVVDVSGVGYELLVSADTVSRMPETGEDVFFHVHTNVREDAITLYGFLEEEGKELFLILKTVSGIGPKLALSILSGLQVADICSAIVAADIKRLTGLQGVGKKTAERICVELKEKVGHLAAARRISTDSVPFFAAHDGVESDALSALTNLGYSDNVARGALAAVKSRHDEKAYEALSVEQLIRDALRTLA